MLRDTAFGGPQHEGQDCGEGPDKTTMLRDAAFGCPQREGSWCGMFFCYRFLPLPFFALIIRRIPAR